MREKNHLLWIGLGVLVLALIAINLAQREDPEPAFRSPSRAAAERSERSPGAAQERAAAQDEPAAPVGPSEPAAADEEPAERAEGSEEISCEHSFVPSALGEWRRYVWRQSGEERSAELRLEARRVRLLPEGEHEVTWRVSVTASDDSSELASEEMVTRCVQGQDAEEPWFGILERSLGLELTAEPGRWRWPAELRTGARFAGTASFDPTGADMRIPEEVRGPQVLRVTRTHVIGERELVEVPAGRYRAFRVDYEEQYAFGERGERGTGTLWVAPDAGLVKSRAENSEGVVQTIELVASGRRRR